ncbi:beta-adaptin-like protein A [Magnolia sinica]|uniref:beta-adaptin-like protein A n=1 Tax=Magnolia sinica TaxID=86752 RepID=UPI00265A9657|nr:beta-adaptin-like protein A [Magnolia sinica]
MLMDVHDRALFYYMLLQYDVAVAERVVDPPKQAVSVFADTQSSEVKDHIFDEFNDLSVVYQKEAFSSRNFIRLYNSQYFLLVALFFFSLLCLLVFKAFL